MKTIIITGGLGFIGSNFIQMMLTNPKYPNLKIINIDNDQFNRKSHNHLSHISNILQNKQRYQYKDVNICNLSKIQALIYLHRPDKIVHFAAESHVDYSITSPESHVYTNVLGTMNLLIASSKYYNVLLNDKQKKKFRFHHISTDQVFGDLKLDSEEKFHEDTKYNPSSPYSATKASSDLLVKAWSRTYNLPISISNCSNNYGKYQDKSKLIPLIINKCVNQLPITIHGSGLYVRDWIHVEDHCKGIIKILNNLQLSNNQTFLFGGNCQRNNLFIINSICNIMDKIRPRENNKKYSDLFTYVQNRPGQDQKYAIDYTKAFNILGWKPQKEYQCQIQNLVLFYLKNEF